MIIISSKNIVKFLTSNFANAITLFPFILVKSKKMKKDFELINHEKIHLRQQIEMLVLPFYVWYLTEFLIHFIRLKSKEKAYFNISFEKEAYANQHNLSYLKKRKFWAFIKFCS